VNDLLIQRINDLLGSDRITSWETDFLESVRDQVKAGKELTERQGDKLDEMEERYA